MRHIPNLGKAIGILVQVNFDIDDMITDLSAFGDADIPGKMINAMVTRKLRLARRRAHALTGLNPNQLIAHARKRVTKFDNWCQRRNYQIMVN